MSAWWAELSDDELESRLDQRGLICPAPPVVVADREDEQVAAFITELLGAEA